MSNFNFPALRNGTIFLAPNGLSYKAENNSWVLIVPESVSRFQAKAALAEKGLLTAVEDLINSAETPLIDRLAWENATEFKRHSVTIAKISSLLGLSNAEVDDLFILAAQQKA